MKKITQLLVSSLLLLSISACGQKGPLILEAPAKPVVTSTTSAASTQSDEKAEVEVPQDEPVLNIQTDETSTAR